MRQMRVLTLDTQRPGFAAECRRQSEIVAKADREDRETGSLMEAAAAEIEGWA